MNLRELLRVMPNCRDGGNNQEVVARDALAEMIRQLGGDESVAYLRIEYATVYVLGLLVAKDTP